MNVAVFGAGTMGHGIAQVCAMGGHSVVIRDIDEDILERGYTTIEENLAEGIDRGKVSETARDSTLDRISLTTSIEDAVRGADVIIEAVPEEIELKKSVFREAEAHGPAEAVIATNTSSLSVTDLSSELNDPRRAIGMHFFNPVHIIDLVEIVVPEQASEETVVFATDFVDGVDKESVVIRDSAGFATSRLGAILGCEAIRMVQEGVATALDIDRAMRLGYNHPMGPLELGDVVGLDVRLDVLNYLHDELGARFRPPQLLKRKVRAGNHGKKSGEGFYIWEDGDIVDVASDGGTVRPG